MLGVAVLSTLAVGATACQTEYGYSSEPTDTTVETSETQGVAGTEAEPINGAKLGQPATAPVRDLAETGEGENVYVDEAGIRRNAGTDEPDCPQAAPVDGRDVNGDHIMFDGSTGLPLCDADGAFLTMPADHDDSESDSDS